MKYIPLNIPTDSRVPEGYNLIMAYAKGDDIVIPIDDIPDEQAHLHSCDWEGCGSLDHVVRFNVNQKYAGTEES